MATSKKSQDFNNLVRELDAELKKCDARINAKQSCIPMLLVGAIVAPFIIWGILFIQPWFLRKKEGDKKVRDGKKIFYYTIALTVVVWLAMFLFSYCKGYNPCSMFCAKW
jgi:hypothetical protein